MSTWPPQLDTAVLSPHGIFTVETKTLSKPPDKDATVVFKDGSLTVNGFTLERDPTQQAKTLGVMSAIIGRAFRKDAQWIM